MSSRAVVPKLDTKRAGRFGAPAMTSWQGRGRRLSPVYSLPGLAAGATKTVQGYQFDQPPERRTAEGEGRVGQGFANDRAHRGGPFGGSEQPACCGGIRSLALCHENFIFDHGAWLLT